MSLSPSILRARDIEILDAERRLADALGTCLHGFQSSAEDAETLRRAIQSLQEPFLLVVAGEFNSGKSAFINALIGDRVLVEGVTPTTAHVTVLRYGETASTRPRPDGIEEVIAPAALLRDVAIVDTPGTNAVLRHHEQLTTEFIPRSDFILFVTSADRPFTESERAFLERIRDWGKKVVVVLNKVDLLRNADDVAEVAAFVRQHSAMLLGASPEVFAISARLAQEARQADSGEEGVRLWDESRLGTLRDALLRTLDDEGRARLKLLSPLGVIERLALSYAGEASKRAALLEEDARTVTTIDEQIEAHAADMRAAFAVRLRAVQTIVLEMRDRGDRFFDDTVRLARVPDLLRGERMRAAFEREVIADVPERITEAADDLIEWIAEQEHRLWQSVHEYLARRRQASTSALGSPGAGDDEHVVGSIGAGFEFNRRAVLKRVATAVEGAVSGYDREEEARQLAGSLQGAVVATAAAGVGAIGLGVGVAVLVGTAAADLTGVTAAIVLGSLGLGVLPLRRRRAKAQLDTRTRELSDALARTLRDQFERELAAGTQRLREALAPYTRFVRIERERVEAAQAELARIQDEAEALRRRIGAEMTGSSTNTQQPVLHPPTALPAHGSPTQQAPTTA
jgi:small GTP-binding protein